MTPDEAPENLPDEETELAKLRRGLEESERKRAELQKMLHQEEETHKTHSFAVTQVIDAWKKKGGELAARVAELKEALGNHPGTDAVLSVACPVCWPDGDGGGARCRAFTGGVRPPATAVRWFHPERVLAAIAAGHPAGGAGMWWHGVQARSRNKQTEIDKLKEVLRDLLEYADSQDMRSRPVFEKAIKMVEEVERG